MAGLCRLAHAKFKKEPSLLRRLERLFSEHIKLYASFGVMDDDIARALESDEDLQDVLAMVEEDLRRVFKKFSVGEEDRKAGDAAATTAGTMNMNEFIGMLSSANLIDNKLTNREAREIFVQVNLDDELFEQEDEENNASPNQIHR